MPWNMFINAQKYFEYKLTVHVDNTTSLSQALNDVQTDQTYRNNFLSYLGLAAQLPNVLFNVLNIVFQFGGTNLTLSITAAIVVEVILFIVTILLAMVDSSAWVPEFLVATLATVVVLNTANGVYQNSVYGLAAKLPPKYSNAVVMGSNISGTFTSIINIAAIALSPNLRVAAIYYFLAALLILLACFDTYFALPINKFYRHYCLTQPAVETKGNRRIFPLYWMVFKHIWVQCFNVFMVFFVSLAIFPALHAGVQPIDREFFGTAERTDKYYSAVNCFLVFNAFAMIGNIVANWVTIPGPKHLWLPVMTRLLFIPFFLFCNYQPELRQWPVIVQNDYLFILGGVLLGLTSGYYSSLCMMYAPRCAPPGHEGTAGMMAAACLVIGIFCGVNFSLVLSWIVKQDWF
ncbi:unnamed protein product [Medioppia subpectinata]|uniref:Equilibrative nucleoside transporter n=1 Tax=Medioppia subpectinata TaxID=1979941 RepID=A0A7R9L3G2_9ACAR|nr:unnamed protein product [Medioppia subpectinata]CAG2114591.1 unnamed protein product [Medioppia subpectinata]